MKQTTKHAAPTPIRPIELVELKHVTGGVMKTRHETTKADGH